MADGLKGKKLYAGLALGGVALVAALASGGQWVAGEESEPAPLEDAAPVGGQMAQAGYAQTGEVQEGSWQAGSTGPGMSGGTGQAEQALEGLAQIRQQQCQMGNQLACQALPTIPGYRRQLAGFAQGCERGENAACQSYDDLARRIFTAYSESAAVMRQGEEGMARMDAWRAQMNRNAANSMANLQAQAARGQAAHEARQESYAAQNRAWSAQQDSMDRQQGRTIDRIYEGTTMQGGGVQSRIPDGSVGYTDGYGNVIAVPEGQRPPDGWQQMDPSYAPPQ